MPDPILDPSLPAGDPAPAADPSPAPADPAPADPALAPTDPAPVEPKAGDWPDDWRQKYTEDPKLLKRLDRYASPKAALDALFAAQDKIRSGDTKTALKPDATPEEVAAWREQNGIPAEPSGYELKLDEGLVIGEADKPMINDFLATAHAANMRPEDVSKAVSWYMSKQDQMSAEMSAKDEAAKESALEVLREEYGPQLKTNLKLALDIIPEGIRDSVLTARSENGVRFGDDPEVMRWLVGLSYELNPLATVVSGSGTNAVQSIEAELAGLKKLMGDRGSEYWKGALAEKHQARYRQLVAAMQKAA